ncbi:unnamed protein product, partial [Prorocentrum cordatum]
ASAGALCYVTDHASVVVGFCERIFDKPSGPNADLWFGAGKIMYRRMGLVSVLFVNSNLSPEQIVDQKVPAWLAVGNATVEPYAAQAAQLARVPEQVMCQVFQVERIAYL